MSSLTNYLDKKFYYQYSDNWDDAKFRSVILEYMKTDHTCLDYGCGRGNVEQMNFLNCAKFVAGVDPEREVLENPFLHEGKFLDLQTNIIQYPNDTFDIVFSDNVMEHIQNPDAVLAEINRVLKPGGVFLFKTPNKHHYMPLIARFTPTWLHRYYNKIRGRDSVDTFPTLYRLNTRKTIEQYSNEYNFVVNNIQILEGRPEYLRLTFLTYLFGVAYERAVNATSKLEACRIVIIATLSKPKL